MGRIAQGWKLRTDPRTGIISVRFRHDGKRYDLSTGTRDPKKAAAKASKRYASVVAGEKPEATEPVRSSLIDIASAWIDSISTSLDKSTVSSYEGYIRNHIAPYFPSLSAIDRKSIGEYTRVRLGHVLKTSVQRELAALSSFLRWCEEQGRIERMPEFPPINRRATGTRAKKIKPRAIDLTLDEVQRFLAALPEWSSIRHQKRFAVRARLVVAFETSLRPKTLATLRAPEHYRRGATSIHIDDVHDKARFGRDVPLSDAARAALDSVCPAEGLIFGSHDFRYLIPKAAKAAGLPPEKASLITSYDLRHNRIRTWLDDGAPLTGVAYQAGHKLLTTTNKYVSVRASIDAAKSTVNSIGRGTGGTEIMKTKSSQKQQVPASRQDARRGLPTPEAQKNGQLPSHTGGDSSSGRVDSGGVGRPLARSLFGLAYLRSLSAGNDEFLYAIAGTLDPEAVAR